MTSKELIEAAERIQYDYHYDTTTMSPELALDLSEHILATVREDDDDEVADEWLRELSDYDSDQNISFGQLWYSTVRMEWTVIDENVDNEVIIKTPQTKGQFRQLCQALGIPLNEEEEE